MSIIFNNFQMTTVIDLILMESWTAIYKLIISILILLEGELLTQDQTYILERLINLSFKEDQLAFE